VNLSDQPYFIVRRRGDAVETSGTPHCVLGRKVEPGQGVFAEWHWDGARLTVQNDRYGFYPLFYYQSDEGVALSPSLVKLLELGTPTELDDAGLAVFLRLGFFIGEDTPFKFIRALPPGATIEWSEGQFKLLAQGLFLLKAQQLSRREAVEAYAALFKAAIQRDPAPTMRFALPLSGGRDSRHILLELCESGFRPDACLTLRHLPPRSNQDSKVAAELCAALGLQHIVLDQPPSRLKTELMKNLLTHFCADEHAWYLALADHLSGRWDVVYDGIGGDVLSAGLFLDERRLDLFEHRDFTRLADVVLNDEGYLPLLLPAPALQRFNRELAINHLIAELTRHAAAPNPEGSFYFWNRTRREIALVPFSILGQVAVVLTPYLDGELYDFLASLPARLMLDKQLHTETIRYAYPRYAGIPFEVKEGAPVLDYKHFRQFGTEMVRYALVGRGRRLVRRSFLVPRVVRGLFDKSYSQSVAWFGPLVVYLLQLDNLILDLENRV
jgi:asparagine synthase (glutamine-hydrolysing)